MPVRRMPVRVQLDARPAGAYASPTWANAVLHAVEQHVPLWKREPGMEWLLAVSSTPLQQSIRHADMAYRNFLRLYKAGRTHIVTNLCFVKLE